MPTGPAQTKWASITVPVQVKEQVLKIAAEEGVAMHSIIEKALSIYKAIRNRTVTVGRAPQGRLHTRSVWYVFKLMLSYAEFRVIVKNKDKFTSEETEQAINSFEYTLYTLRERLKIITPEEYQRILALAREYMKTRSTKILRDLNDMIREIMFRVMALTK